MATLKVAFVWHMHQPWYLWPGTREAALSYVRFHACSAYYDMPWLLQEFPGTTVTFNLVPSLTEQIARYARGETTDPLLELCRRPVADLSPQDQAQLLVHFARGQTEWALEASPRYAALSHKRGHVRNSLDAERVCRAFTAAECRDVQVWLNLAWCGYALHRESEVVRELRAKDREFGEDEKLSLMAEMQAAIGRVLNLYRQAASDGRAELTTSPFYHPILPLLADMTDAQRVIPRSALPEALWRAPEEARRQLQLARAHHESHFGAPPQGLWSPEGAVSDASLALVGEAGFGWSASDDEVLARALHPEADARPGAAELYQPYRFGESSLALLFRDHALSDRIGFVYRDWEPEDAAQDLVGHLRGIASTASGSGVPGIVCLILDGENPWGSYPDGGEAFLRAVYRGIEAAPDLQTTSVTDYLREFPPRAHLASVFPGSWIDHSYGTWIGSPEHKRAWTLLGGALEAIEAAEPDQAAKAREPLMVAEGSDWFWWYGAQHHARDEDVFDALFRANVAEVYRSLRLAEPAALADPIVSTKTGWLAQEAAGATHVTLDGRITSYFEWQPAALLRMSAMASAMHRSNVVIRAVYLGFDRENLWLRVDTVGHADETLRGCRLRFVFAGAAERELALEWPENDPGSPPRRHGDLAGAADAAAGRIVEARIGLDALGAALGGTLGVAVSLDCGGRPVERWPQVGFLELRVPSDDTLSGDWTA